MAGGDGAYAVLTEGPGKSVSAEGADMQYSRYAYAAEVSAGKRVLEIGCGPGLGLGLLNRAATIVVGGDYDGVLLQQARDTYGARVPLVQLDVQTLPIKNAAFDVVLFFEGTYYVPDMERALDEMIRILMPGGSLLFVNANPERADFISSPLSVHYHTGSEFRRALEKRGFDVRVEGTFPVETHGMIGRCMTWVRRIAQRFGLIPKTLRGRTLLKRLFVGRLIPVPGELTEGFGSRAERVPVRGDQPIPHYKVIYVTATHRKIG